MSTTFDAQSMGRFAPSATGRAHPGTLLAALLCWLDQRQRGGQVVLRLEDLDSERCTDAFRHGLIDDLTWLGLSWDQVVFQRDRLDAYAQAMDTLAAAGRLYPSPVSRSELAHLGQRGPDGGWRYDNRDRQILLPAGGWRACTDVAIRCRLDAGLITVPDVNGWDLAMDPAAELGDPIVRRRDGAFMYHLVSVVDDAAAGVTDVVRGHDLCTSTAPQVALQRLLNVPTPTYRHHLLLLEQRAAKLSKFHGAVAVPELQHHLSGLACCGWLAWVAGLQAEPRPCHPNDVIANFTWNRVRRDDVTVGWNGTELTITP